MSYTGGYKHWNPNDVFTSADVNEFFMSQAIPRFASAAARDAALTGADSPATGQMAYVGGVGLTQYNGTSWGLWQGATYTDSKTVTVAANSVTFTGIPRTLKTVVIRGSAKNTDTLTGNLPFFCALGTDNGTTGTNYYYGWHLGTNSASSSAGAGGTANAHISYLPNSGFSIWGTFTLTFTAWDQPSGRTGCAWHCVGGYAGGAGGLYTAFTSIGSWVGTSTLDKITLLLAAGHNIAVGSTFTLTGTY